MCIKFCSRTVTKNTGIKHPETHMPHTRSYKAYCKKQKKAFNEWVKYKVGSNMTQRNSRILYNKSQEIKFGQRAQPFLF